MTAKLKGIYINVTELQRPLVGHRTPCARPEPSLTFWFISTLQRWNKDHRPSTPKTHPKLRRWYPEFPIHCPRYETKGKGVPKCYCMRLRPLEIKRTYLVLNEAPQILPAAFGQGKGRESSERCAFLYNVCSCLIRWIVLRGMLCH